MKVIVTCGPSYEPIDEVRRITNFSTGQLGTELTNYLVAQGHEVICLRGEGSTFCGKNRATQLISFSTSENLKSHLQNLASFLDIQTIFHTAAIGDYQVVSIKNDRGEAIHTPKIPTSTGEIILQLKPAEKILSKLRTWFPKAFIIGWKYEVEGNFSSVLAKASQQILHYQTDACVVNGPVLKKQFILYQKNNFHYSITNRLDLFQALLRLI